MAGMHLTAILAAGVITASALAHAEAGFLRKYFTGSDDRRECYARIYDARHLRVHPRQRLRSMFITSTSRDDPREFFIGYAFRLKNDSDLYAGLAYCREQGAGAHCLVEGDGGDFTLAAAGTGLKLNVGERWEVEGERGVSPDLALGGDDRVILLHRKPETDCVEIRKLWPQGAGSND